MQTIYRLNATELDYQFFESLQRLFKDKEIEIIVSEVDETAYLMSTAANRKQLLSAIKNLENGANLVTMKMDELEALVDEP